LQVETLLSQNESDYVYFAEDDYFYLPGAFEELYNFFHEIKADFATPYDHLDLYTMKLHDYRSKIEIHGTRHWRNVSSTCMTFLTHKKALAKTKRIFLSYARRNDDLSLWMSLTKIKIFDPFVYLKYMFRGDRIFKALLKAWYFGWWQILFGRKYKLWSPMPTVGTHMEGISLSPGFNWDEKFRKYL
jgi:hypothetical protein